VILSRNERRFRRRTTDRAAFAHERGWRHAARASGLGERWTEVLGRRAGSIGPFGVISGELDGLPFTVFDAMTGLDLAPVDVPRTTWMVHLPVAYPRLVVPRPPAVLRDVVGGIFGEAFLEASSVDFGAPGPLRPEDLHAETDRPGFAEALLTAEVRSATAAWGLAGWEIAGRDLVFTSLGNGSTTPPAQIDAVLRRLVALARLFPSELAQHYGAPPSTDVPSIG
jgi:hypothetical protein